MKINAEKIGIWHAIIMKSITRKNKKYNFVVYRIKKESNEICFQNMFGRTIKINKNEMVEIL